MKPRLAPEAEALLWKAVESAKANPSTFSIRSGGETLLWELKHGRTLSDCGSVGCIAAHICIANGSLEVYDPLESAARILDVVTPDSNSEYGDAENLFFSYKFNGQLVTAHNLTERVNHWLATGE